MRKWSRRDFAKHAGMATLFTPFISMLDGRPADAATAGKAKYFLLFYTNGTAPDQWTPKGSSESSIKFSAMTEPLSAIKDSVILADGMSGGGTAGSHGSPGGLCGRGFGNPTHISVDQVISDGLKTLGVNTQIPNLVLGGVSDQTQCDFYRGGKVLTPIFSPSTAFSTIFGGAKAAPMPAQPSTTTGMPGASAPVVDFAKRRKSILDLMITQIGQLEQGLGSVEKAKLESHAESIRQLEKRIQAQTMASMGGTGGSTGGGGGVSTVACKAPAQPGATSEPLLASASMLDLAVNAFACDLTRVAAVQFGHHQATPITIKEITETPSDWHNGFCHSEMSPFPHLVKTEAWLCKQFVRTAEMLKALPAPDGNGTLYDQTLMFWARDMGDAVLHNDTNMRFVFAGGAGGAIKYSPNGRYVNASGRHNKALLSAIETMGVTASNFGDGSEKTGLSLG